MAKKTTPTARAMRIKGTAQIVIVDDHRAVGVGNVDQLASLAEQLSRAAREGLPVIAPDDPRLADRWATVAEVCAAYARATGRSLQGSTVQRACQRGGVPGALRLDGVWRIPPDGLKRWVIDATHHRRGPKVRKDTPQ